jgi:acetyl esterase/lipase
VKNIFSFFLCLFISCLSSGQTADILQKKADSLYKAKDFRNAAMAFSTALKLIPPSQHGLVLRTSMLAARSWSLANVRDSAFVLLESVATSRAFVYNSLVTLVNEKDFIPLQHDNRWQVLTRNLFDVVTRQTRVPIDTGYTQVEIIYGRKDGMALTMLHLRPKTGLRQRGIILVRSGGWGSNFFMANTEEALPYLKNGYDVFIVFHGSEPVYSIADAIEDIQRAIRFIRYNAPTYSIDPGKLGIMGISAGAHLALSSGLIDSSFVTNSPDPVDRMFPKVQAVVSFYPASDFLNYNGEGQDASSAELFKHLSHLLDFRKWNPQRRQFNLVTDSTEWRAMLKKISPVNYVSSNDAPVLIFHGDQDEIVPIRQTELLVKKMQDAKIPVSFIFKKGQGHGWPRSEEEQQMILDWFGKYLK